MQRRLLQSFTYILEWRQGTCTLTKHTRRWTYPTLRHFFKEFQYKTFRYFLCFCIALREGLKENSGIFYLGGWVGLAVDQFSVIYLLFFEKKYEQTYFFQ